MRQLAFLLALAGCQDALDQRLAIVREPRVLAIVSDPAEVKPGGAVAYSALVATPDGPATDPEHWALCVAPKAPTEDNAVSTDCTGDTSLLDLGAAQTVAAIVPAQACVLFGPDVPPGGFRPRDPDPTGGFYQPVRARLAGGDLAFGFTRVTCKLANAPTDVAHDYDLHYAANANPTVALAVPATVSAGSTVDLVASWPAEAAESFLYYDPQREELVPRREAMRVSWFATGGAIAVDASAVDETDDATSVSTTWRAPTSPGSAWLWIVLRDSRGGIATQTMEVTVQ
jgi:hypothetical protein